MNDGTTHLDAQLPQVWKFLLNEEITVLEMPKGAIIRHVAIQMQEDGSGRICLWAEVQPDEPKVSRTFRQFDTGTPIGIKPLRRQYLATVGTPVTNETVTHIYEVTT